MSWSTLSQGGIDDCDYWHYRQESTHRYGSWFQEYKCGREKELSQMHLSGGLRSMDWCVGAPKGYFVVREADCVPIPSEMWLEARVLNGYHYCPTSVPV